ncbi:MAG: Rrf2 family transcriptional regulator [Elusimicrobia bacterium]|nr:Rrf2 family transcriptional regulator [Elusimicrobiota bacterium]
MRITSSVDCATRVMVRLSELKEQETISAEKLSEAENIPRDFIGQLMLKLRRAGLVASRRGAQGGYALAKPPSAISLGMVVRAVEDNVFDVVCDRLAVRKQDCRHSSGCGIRPVWRKLGALVESFLDRMTIEQVASEEASVEKLFK